LGHPTEEETNIENQNDIERLNIVLNSSITADESKLNNKTEHNKLFQTLGRTHVKHADFKIPPLVFLIHF
jgi:hypothetical protein